MGKGNRTGIGTKSSGSARYVINRMEILIFIVAYPRLLLVFQMFIPVMVFGGIVLICFVQRAPVGKANPTGIGTKSSDTGRYVFIRLEI